MTEKWRETMNMEIVWMYGFDHFFSFVDLEAVSS